MGWLSDLGSAVVGGIPAAIAGHYNGGIKNVLFGGQDTKNLPTQTANYDYAQGYIKNQLGGLAGRAAPTSQMYTMGAAAHLDPAQQARARAQQQQLADRLGLIAGGQQAGAGELAVNRQVGQATAAQQAAARMARGANAALAMRNSARNTADLGVAGAGQAAMAQMQDQAAANGQLAGILQGMRGQDLDLAGQNAAFQQQQMMQQGQFGQQTNLANQQAQLAQTGMNDSAQLGYLAQLLGLDQAQLAALYQAKGLQMGDKGIFPQVLQTAGQMGAAYAGGGVG